MLSDALPYPCSDPPDWCHICMHESITPVLSWTFCDGVSFDDSCDTIWLLKRAAGVLGLHAIAAQLFCCLPQRLGSLVDWIYPRWYIDNYGF